MVQRESDSCILEKVSKFVPLFTGSAGEKKRRAGTENVPGIVGIGTAAKRAADTREERTASEVEVRDYLIDRVLKGDSCTAD